MKIGIIAPSPVPFTVGGAEKLWWGLLREINSNTSHQAELLKVPTREHGFWDLVDSYEQFYRLDVSHFDVVISTKYPAWMVSHPNHVCYMQHRLRGFYDCYHFNRLPEEYFTTHPDLLSLRRLLSAPVVSRDSFDEVLSRLRALRGRPDIPADAWNFPGSLVKEVVHFFDRVGLQCSAIERYCAISYTVADRRSYFPLGAAVDVIYHPSNLDEFLSLGSEYFFTASRLDGPKRISLLIEAMGFVEADVELRIAGEGPEEGRLKRMAEKDRRIVFLGYRSDAQLVQDYANALAVAFVPYDEDYGLITIEAMMSGKPVLTCTDSGGPTEFVRDNETGFCVPNAPKRIGEALQSFANDRAAAARMGKKARTLVHSITWGNTVRSLLGSQSARRPRCGSRTRKLTVATTFPVTPVRGGGQARIYHLFKNMASAFETEVVTLVNPDETESSSEIAPGVREVRIPKSKEHVEAENAISAEVEWFSITDVVFPRLSHLTPRYLEALASSCQQADVIVASHPYTFNSIEGLTDKPLWYEAQDVEFLLKKDVIPRTRRGMELVQEVRAIEQRCCEKAEIVMACSTGDGELLAQLYSIPKTKLRTVPNGVDSKQIRFISRSESSRAKRELGFGGTFVTIFIGSWHEPNLEAIRNIISLASHFPDCAFLILGSSCLAFESAATPANVGLCGVVDDAVKAIILGAGDVALNPMKNGSGTNLKMLEYAASGLPIVTTPIGTRGLGFEDNAEIFVAEIQEFGGKLNFVRKAEPHILQNMAWKARQRAETEFDWANIAQNLLSSI